MNIKQNKKTHWADALREIISIICKCRSPPLPPAKMKINYSPPDLGSWQLMWKGSMHCLLLRTGHGKLIANPCLPGKLTNSSWYIHNNIRHVISFHFGHFRVKFGQIHWKKTRCIARVQTFHFNMFLLDIHRFKLRKRSKSR